MNKQERIQTIQTIRKRMKPVRMVSACFAAIGFLILFLTDQPIWSIFLIVFALILFGISSRKMFRNLSDNKHETSQTVDSTELCC